MAIMAAQAIWSGVLQYLNRRLDLEVQRNKAESQVRDAVTDDRVDSIYRANYERGVMAAKKRPDLVNPPSVKAIPHGGTMANLVLDPASITPEVREAYKPIVPFLREIRKQYPDPAKFSEVVLKEHGAWLLRHICDPLDVKDFECLAIARAVSEDVCETVSSDDISTAPI